MLVLIPLPSVTAPTMMHLIFPLLVIFLSSMSSRPHLLMGHLEVLGPLLYFLPIVMVIAAEETQRLGKEPMGGISEGHTLAC